MILSLNGRVAIRPQRRSGDRLSIDGIAGTDSATLALTRPLLITMAAASGLGIANLYYSQPLLGEIARDLHVGVGGVGTLPMLTQVGFAAGVFFLAPLGDVLERRRLVVTVLLGAALSLVAAAFAPTLPLLAIVSVAIGISSVISTLVLPFAVALAPPERRGATVGTIVSALLIGILGSRTLSGFVGGIAGWRFVYGMASGIMVILAVLLRALLPQSRGGTTLAYPALLRSMLHLFRTEPLLRTATWNGMLCYGALTTFWTTLAFLLAGPAYHLGPAVAGAFGLVGAASALAAPIVGKLADRMSPRTIVGASVIAMLVSFLVLWAFGQHLAGLIVGVIGIDLAAQTATVANQASVYSLPPAAHSRLYTIYRAAYSLGGAAGAYLSTLGWSLFGWNGVCAVAVCLLSVALAAHIRAQREPQISEA